MTYAVLIITTVLVLVSVHIWRHSSCYLRGLLMNLFSLPLCFVAKYFSNRKRLTLDHRADQYNRYLTRAGYPVMKTVFGPLVRKLWIGKIHGLDNIPNEGACLIASNHESYFDFICFTAAIDRKIHYLAAEKFFGNPFWKWVMRFMGCIRIDRFSGITPGAYREIAAVVKRGRLVGIFPEGTRSPDGRLMAGKTGIAHLALRTGIPVIPVGMIGTHEIMSCRDRLPRLRKATIRIGEPISFEHLTGAKPDNSLLRHVTDEIMLRIAALTREEYAPVVEKEYHESP